MQQSLHPKYHHNTTATCACGNTFVTGSILPEIKVEVCSACHPFWTGEKKLVDTEGQVDKFMRRTKTAQAAQKARRVRLTEKTAKKTLKKGQKGPLTLRELLSSKSLP